MNGCKSKLARTNSQQSAAFNYWGKASLISAWAIAVLFGFARLAAYSYQVEESQTRPPSTFHHSTATTESPSTKKQTFTILFFIHPRCPCSWASARELKRSLAALKEEPLSLNVYVFRPSSEDLEWTTTPLRHYTSQIARATAYDDADGEIAASYGATTSGTVMAYSPKGTLEFTGGITSSRGHEGKSLGSQMLVKAIRGEPVKTRQTPVFGCLF